MSKAKHISFDTLPEVVHELVQRIERIESLILDIHKNKTSNQNELLNIKEAAQLLSLKPATIYSKVCKREIPASKRGKRLYFSREALKNWLLSGKLKSKNELYSEADQKLKSSNNNQNN